MQWTSGGGGAAAAVQNAAGAITAGSANVVVAYRGLAQGQFGRFGRSGGSRPVSGGAAYTLPYGMMSAAQMYAMRTTRFMHEHGVGRNAMRSIAMACYHHAQNNPRAVMNGRTLDAETYDASRWITEPYRLFDCCLENDGAAAMIITRSDRAMDLPKVPALVLGAQQSGGHRSGATAENATDYVTSSFKPAAKYLYEQAGVTPQDIDVVQSYENFTGGVVMSLIEHGLCTYENADEVLTFENLRADGGNLPLNTSGGNLAECYMHGLGLQVEAVRQVRGESCNQVPNVKVALANAGPMVAVASTAIYGTQEALG
jgi:acetyl-CoA acetyltransferase